MPHSGNLIEYKKNNKKREKEKFRIDWSEMENVPWLVISSLGDGEHTHWWGLMVAPWWSRPKLLVVDWGE